VSAGKCGNDFSSVFAALKERLEMKYERKGDSEKKKTSFEKLFSSS
jgi:hypothetical protein